MDFLRQTPDASVINFATNISAGEEGILHFHVTQSLKADAY